MSNFVSIPHPPPDFFRDFSFISNVFIRICEYIKKIIYIFYHKIKVLCLRINLIAK